MIYIEETKIGDVIKCGSTKAVVTFIDGDEVHILREWGETDILREEHCQFWDNIGTVRQTLKDLLGQLETIK